MHFQRIEEKGPQAELGNEGNEELRRGSWQAGSLPYVKLVAGSLQV